MITRLLVTGAAIAFAASRAFAADVAEPSAYDWSGPYVGLTAGYAWGSADGSVEIPPDTEIDELAAELAEDVLDGNTKADGFNGGLTLGFNHQIDNLVLGIEGDASFLDLDGSREAERPGFGAARGRDELKADFLATLRLRAGLALDQTLVYLTGGGAYTDAKVRRDLDWSFVSGCPDAGGDYERCHSGNAEFDIGWTIGAGIEQALASNLSLKIEYLYADFGKEEFATENPEVEGQTMRHSFDLDMHIVRAGVNLRF